MQSSLPQLPAVTVLMGTFSPPCSPDLSIGSGITKVHAVPLGTHSLGVVYSPCCLPGRVLASQAQGPGLHSQHSRKGAFAWPNLIRLLGTLVGHVRLT